MGVSYFLPYFFPWAVVLIISLILFWENKGKNKFKQREQGIIQSLEERDKAFRATSALNAIILETLDFKLAAQRIANAIPQFLGYETGVLALVDEKQGVLKRTAISDTPGGRAAVKSLSIPFESIEIKLSETENLCIRALKENRSFHTTSLYDVLRPVVSKENADKTQMMMGTKITLIFPIYSRDNKPFGTFLISLNKTYDQISEYEHQTIVNFVDGIRIVLENAILYTSLSKTTEELKNSNERLKELDRLKDDFVSVASHELRTPMTAIRSYLWMALKGRGGDLNERQSFYLNRAYKSTVRLINLVNDMLNISRIESGRVSVNIQKTDLTELVDSVLGEVKPRADELGLHLEVKKRSLPPVLADGDKVKEVLINLVGNSLKFTPQGGNITVSFDVAEDSVITRVTDTGAGISPEDQKHLFQKFGFIGTSYKVNKSDSQGTGLGLYISKSIVDLHKGKMSVFSEGQGKGSAFSFSLKTYNDHDFTAFEREFSDQKNGLGVIHIDI